LDSYRGGWIEIIAGGMFSGKSEELIRRLRRSVIARQRVQVFKPLIDDRFSTEDIVSRDDRRLKAHSVATSAELLARVEIGIQVVGIDEIQFFDAGVVDVCMQLADAGIRVIAAGLDQDYMRRPFGPMPALLASAYGTAGAMRIFGRAGARSTMGMALLVMAVLTLGGPWLVAHSGIHAMDWLPLDCITP